MLRIAQPFFASVSFALGNGRTAPFWSARWTGETALMNRFPLLYASAKHKHLSVRSWVLRFGGSGASASAFSLPLSLAEHDEFLHL